MSKCGLINTLDLTKEISTSSTLSKGKNIGIGSLPILWGPWFGILNFWKLTSNKLPTSFDPSIFTSTICCQYSCPRLSLHLIFSGTPKLCLPRSPNRQLNHAVGDHIVRPATQRHAAPNSFASSSSHFLPFHTYVFPHLQSSLMPLPFHPTPLFPSRCAWLPLYRENTFVKAGNWSSYIWTNPISFPPVS